MITYLQRIEWFVGLVLLQVLVLNRMHINGYATPFFFIYFILKYNSGVSRNTLMVWSFLLGLSVDIFSNNTGRLKNEKVSITSKMVQNRNVHNRIYRK